MADLVSCLQVAPQGGGETVGHTHPARRLFLATLPSECELLRIVSQSNAFYTIDRLKFPSVTPTCDQRLCVSLIIQCLQLPQVR